MTVELDGEVGRIAQSGGSPPRRRTDRARRAHRRSGYGKRRPCAALGEQRRERLSSARDESSQPSATSRPRSRVADTRAIPLGNLVRVSARASPASARGTQGGNIDPAPAGGKRGVHVPLQQPAPGHDSAIRIGVDDAGDAIDFVSGAGRQRSGLDLVDAGFRQASDGDGALRS